MYLKVVSRPTNRNYPGAETGLLSQRALLHSGNETLVVCLPSYPARFDRCFRRLGSQNLVIETLTDFRNLWNRSKIMHFVNSEMYSVCCCSLLTWRCLHFPRRAVFPGLCVVSPTGVPCAVCLSLHFPCRAVFPGLGVAVSYTHLRAHET